MTQEALTRAIEGLAIRDVYIAETSARLGEGYNPKLNDEPLAVQVRHQPSSEVQLATVSDNRHNGLKLVFFRVATGVRLVQQRHDEEEAEVEETRKNRPICAELTATFIAEYRITSDDLPDQDAFAAFARQNVVYHVWPYWREYVQSMTGRLRLPDIVLPMFRLPKEHRNERPPKTE